MKHIFLVTFLVFTVFFSTQAQSVKVSEDNTVSAVHPSAIFEVESTSKGVLLPRLTTTQRDNIVTPVPEGLLIFNTDTNCVEIFNGNDWDAFCG
ncbi:MAG: hypothetical protein EA412_02375 [Chitinophagaceae bacterium]|nr:MAG: hypothetical protein EA412_02375 [Chitinophagaceae bacterium]